MVSNSGGAVLNGSASVASTVFVLSSTNAFAVAPSGSTNLAVEFAPTNSGLFSNIVVFATDGGSSSNAVYGRSLSPPFLTVVPAESTNFEFSFESFEGFSYTIDYKNDLTDPVWQPLSTNAGTGSTITSTNPVAAPPQRLYRLRVQ